VGGVSQLRRVLCHVAPFPNSRQTPTSAQSAENADHENSCVKTLWFSKRLSETTWIKEFALSPTYKETLYKRVVHASKKVGAINVAKAATTTRNADAVARTLMRTCREILEWKQECAGILERIELMYNDAKERLSPSPRRTQPELADFPEKLWRGSRLLADAGAFNSRKGWDRILEGYTGSPMISDPHRKPVKVMRPTARQREQGLSRLETILQRERELVQRMLEPIYTRTEDVAPPRHRRRSKTRVA
jgi:hypothetical protein